MGQHISRTLKNILVALGALGFTGMSAAQSQENRSDTPDHSIYVAGLRVGEDQTAERLQEVAKMILGGEKGFRFQDRTFENVGQGISGLFLKSLASGAFQLPRSFDKFEGESKGSGQCAQAKKDKIEFHKNSGGIPAAFGKVIDLNMVEYHLYWAGSLSLCTWIAADDTYDEYLIHIDFRANNDGTLRTHVNSGDEKDPFPGTLEGLTPKMIEMISAWDFKIHGTGDAIQIHSVWRNGGYIDPVSQPDAYINDENCFDFFVGSLFELTQLRAGVLPDQTGYCLGRCDGLIMNTK